MIKDLQVKSWASSGKLKKDSKSEPVDTRTYSEPIGERGHGSFLMERRPSGAIEIYLLLRRGTKQERKKLGSYGDIDADTKEAISLTRWREMAKVESAKLRQFDSKADLLRYEDKAEKARARAEAQEARQGTLGQLLDAYVANMERLGRVSHKEVKGALELNVFKPFPELIAAKAKEIEPSDIATILRHCLNRPVAEKGRGKRLTTAHATNGKKRQADKVRSYLQAAFAFGLKHDLNPLRAGDDVQFGLKANPVRDVPVVEGANQANTWALTKDEFKELLLAVEHLPERRRDIAKAMLYLAGQRVEMLARVTWVDIYADGDHGLVMRLVDVKGGKDTPPREHLLPISGRLSEVMQPLLALQFDSKADGPFTLSGASRMAASSGLSLFSELGDELSRQGKTRRFTWRNLRATIETHLAALGVTQERRAWLLSHGRSGVQAKHYDRYNYLLEKRQDLGKWARYLDQLTGVGGAGQVICGRFGDSQI